MSKDTKPAKAVKDPKPAPMPDEPACDLCGDNGPLVLRSKCHGTAPLRMELEGNVLTARCYIPECNRVVSRFQIETVAPIAPRSGVAITAIVRGFAQPGQLIGQAGDLVFVELPANCTVNQMPGYDAAAMLRVMDLAQRLGAHWRDQEGVNASLLEELAEATRR